jgi:hypothetical protein
MAALAPPLCVIKNRTVAILRYITTSGPFGLSRFNALAALYPGSNGEISEISESELEASLQLWSQSLCRCKNRDFMCGRCQNRDPLNAKIRQLAHELITTENASLRISEDAALDLGNLVENVFQELLITDIDMIARTDTDTDTDSVGEVEEGIYACIIVEKYGEDAQSNPGLEMLLNFFKEEMTGWNWIMRYLNGTRKEMVQSLECSQRRIKHRHAMLYLEEMYDDLDPAERVLKNALDLVAMQDEHIGFNAALDRWKSVCGMVNDFASANSNYPITYSQTHALLRHLVEKHNAGETVDEMRRSLPAFLCSIVDDHRTD